MKRRRVVFAPEARDDLFELYDWIAATAGSVVAMSYVERIEAYCLGFDVVSERGHRRDNVRPGLRIVGFERRVEFEQLQKLRKQPLALWLHGFGSSHAAPYPLKINTIHRLSGSGAQTLRDFKYRMRKALEALVAIGAIDSFVIEEGSVKIKKTPIPSKL